jgi:NAD(P)-dependent dehydrogenase (short-subunit alcohol dehydrogenase family)
MSVAGKAVAITGAGRGIGAAAARAFAAAGARVMLLARSGDEVARLAEAIVAAGGTAQALACDVARPGDVARAVEATVAAFGRLDVLVNNAGVMGPMAAIEATDAEAWGAAIDINLKGVYHGMRAALPVMRAQGGGSLLTLGSGAAYTALEGWSAYCASKAGALMLTRAADLEGRADGIRAISLSPGTVETDMQVQIRASRINRVSRLDPSAHIPPDWPARALVWMCGPEADEFLGAEVSLRDAGIRRRIGLE